jgi:acyl carrier protein
MTPQPNREEIAHILLSYLLDTNPVARDYGPIPRDQSLYELGILDSGGVIELVVFIETRWLIQIDDAELTKERFGGIDKMAEVVFTKLTASAA